MGSGRTGFSTGVGPVGYYTSVGGASRSRSSGAATRELRSAGATPLAMEKAAEGRRLADALDAVANLHRAEFPAAVHPQAGPPAPVDVPAIVKRHRAEAKHATSFFARAERRAALAAAEVNAAAEAAATQEAAQADRDRHQGELDVWWGGLLGNDPGIVIWALSDAFEDNDAAAAPIGVDGASVSIVVLVPAVDTVPERRPTLTAAGNVSLKKLTMTETNSFYVEMVAGHVLVTVKEAFAVAPGIETANVVGLRVDRTDSYGKPHVEVVVAAELTRASLAGIRWSTASALEVLGDASTDLLLDLRGRTSEVVPLDLSARPDLRAVVDAVDVGELLA